MKKLLLLTLIVLGGVAIQAQQITALPAVVVTAGTDIVIVEDAAATNHITVTNLFGTIPVDVAVAGRISALRTTEQFRLSYDATNYLTVLMLNDGYTTIATEDPDGAEADINISPDGNVGILTIDPSTALEVTGTVTSTAVATATITNTGITTTYVLVADSANIDTLLVTDVATVEGVLTAQKLEALRTTEQLRLSYDATNYLTATLADDGHTTIATVDPGGAEADINFTPDGNVGINTAAPGEALDVTGDIKTSADIHVDNDVLLLDGAVVGITGNEVITFNAAGSVNVSGATMDVDGAFTASSVASDGAVSGTTFAASGEITGKTMVVLVTAATWAITDLDSAQNVVYINDDADVIDFTLPGAVKGLVVMFYDLGGAVITIDPFDGTDTIYLNGATVGAGDAIDSPGAVGDFICLVALDATRWITTGRAGVWVDGGTD